MSRAYLTIDDSPSETTVNLIDALDERSIQALFFCRGDRMENNLCDLVHAIKKGHVLGNHSYAHKRSSELSFEGWAEDLEQAEKLIDKAYCYANILRPAKYYRFPYLDRGDGELLERIWPEITTRVYAGENYELVESDEVRTRQSYLKEQGFIQPFTELNHPLYKHVPAIAGATDTLLTDTVQDWRMLSRHLAREETTLEDLKKQLRDDPVIAQNVHEHVILLHDDPEIYHVVLGFIDFLRDELGFKFQTLDL